MRFAFKIREKIKPWECGVAAVGFRKTSSVKLIPWFGKGRESTQ